MLNISKVETFYGNIQALRGVDVKVNDGEIVALIGSNGAGKSTLLMTISGVNKAATGEILFDSKSIANMPPHDIVNLGISQVPEGRRIFSRLTVEDNLRLGASVNEKGKNFDKDSKDVYDLFPVLKEKRNQSAGELSGGQRQQVAFGRALMTKPKILMLDEPTAGVSPIVMDELFSRIIEVRKTGVGILMVEQNAKQALGIADRGYVLVNGKNSREGSGEELLNNPEVRKSFLGG